MRSSGRDDGRTAPDGGRTGPCSARRARPPAVAVVLAVLLALLVGAALAGCSGAATPTPRRGPLAEAPMAPVDADRVLVLTDQAGRTVRLPEPAERVVALDWAAAEDLGALGVPPVAVADVDGYRRAVAPWSAAEALPAGTRDVVSAADPDMDAVFAARADLVVVATYPGSPVVRRLMALDVPVLVLSGGDAGDQIASQRATVRLLGAAVGAPARAEALVRALDRSLTAGRALAARSGAAGARLLLADAYRDPADPDLVAVRPWGTGSLAGAVTERLGLVNAWDHPGDPVRGLDVTDVAGLAGAGSARGGRRTTLVLAPAQPAGPAIGPGVATPTDATGPGSSADLPTDVARRAPTWRDVLAAQPGWARTGLDRPGAVRSLPTGTWPFGGIRSTQRLARALAGLAPAARG